MVVFLCGTYVDLTAEREAVLASIREMQHAHQAMEFFGARPDRPIETCLEEVRASDIVVVVLGFLYGSIVPGSDRSYTQAEYQEAFSLGKTCLIYLRDEDSLIPAKYMERDPAKMSRLKEFRDLLEGRHTVVKFRDAHELATGVTADLNRIGEKANRPNVPESDLNRNVQDRLARELEIGAALQRQLLPQHSLKGDRFDVAGCAEAALVLNGDYYDFFAYENSSVALIIADASGKGLPAALMTLSLQARLHTLAEYRHTPARLMTRLNRGFGVMPDNRFITMIFALLNFENGELVYCNAGHIPPMIARGDGTVERLSGGGHILGWLPDREFPQDTVRLAAGDVVMLCSDGVTEALDPDGDEFGEDRVASILRDNRTRTAEEIVENVVRGAIAWTGSQPLADDLSIVVARWL
jgi:serine phosphatase RsbU (regulator of sigma subunit)